MENIIFQTQSCVNISDNVIDYRLWSPVFYKWPSMFLANEEKHYWKTLHMYIVDTSFIKLYYITVEIMSPWAKTVEPTHTDTTFTSLFKVINFCLSLLNGKSTMVESWWRLTWTLSPHYWSFIRRNHQSPVDSTHKGQWFRARMFIFVGINKLLNKQENCLQFQTPSHSCDIIVIHGE